MRTMTDSIKVNFGEGVIVEIRGDERVRPGEMHFEIPRSEFRRAWAEGRARIEHERIDHYDTLEVWQSEHRREQRLNNLGFGGDGDVVALGLDEMEDELTLEDVRAGRFTFERHRYRGIPVSMCTPEEARRAREADIDDMTRKEWDDES